MSDASAHDTDPGTERTARSGEAAGSTTPSPGAGRRGRRVVAVRGTPARSADAAFAATLSPSEALALADTRPPSAAPISPRWDASRLPIVERASYDVTGSVAQGGIGRVLRARDGRLGRAVALKELLDPSPAAEERFLREALVTARLQHPSIVPIYEAGRWPTGEPFYAMKLVSGRSLDEVIQEQGSLAERLGLLPHVLAVAEAVAYAHSQRLIHRDLKPANVLVGDFGETVVIDWGLAKDLDASDHDPARPSQPDGDADPQAALTLAGEVMGTPAYMPPEQAAGRAVDERADVYALGAILYHMLAGAPPYDGATAREIVGKVLAGPPPSLASRQKDISDDLLAIVRKAMAHDPAGRYPSARELAEDLRRFETGQIVGAHRYSSMDLLRRFFRRYKAPLAVAAAALATLALVVTYAVRRNVEQRVRAEQKQVEAEEAQQRAVAHADDLTLVQARASAVRDPNEALAWLRVLSPAFTRWPEARLVAAEARARGVATVLRGHRALLNFVVFSPDGTLLATASDDHTARIWDVATGSSRVLAGHTDEVWFAAFVADGKRLVTGSKDDTVRLWDVATGEHRVLHADTRVGKVSFVGEFDAGRRIVATVGSTLLTWDAETAERQVLAPSAEKVLAAMSRDARLFARRTYDGVLSIEDASTGERRVLERGAPRGPGKNGAEVEGALLFSSDATVLAEVTLDGLVRWWDIATGKSHDLAQTSTVRLATGLSPARRLAFSPDGATLAVVEADSSVRLWDLGAGTSRVLRGHEGAVMRMVFSPDGKILATGAFDHTVRLWDVASGRSRVLFGHADAVMNLAFSPDGQLVASAAADHTARIFPVAAAAGRVLENTGAITALSEFSQDGRQLATGDRDGRVLLWDVDTGAAAALEGHEGPVSAAAFSPDGEVLATAAHDGLLRLSDRAGRSIGAFANPGKEAIHALVFSPDGALVATGDAGGKVRLRDVDTGAERVFDGHEGAAAALAFSRDGELLASGGWDKTVRVWRIATGEVRVLEGHQLQVLSVAFSPDGRTLVSGSKDHTLRFWDVATGEGRAADASGNGVFQLLFSADGATLVSAGEFDTGVRLWDVATATQRALLRGHGGELRHFALSPDGARLATASTDRTVRLWDLASGESRALQGHEGPVERVAFSPDGRLVASAGEDGTVQLWADDLPSDAAGLRAFIASAAPDEAPAARP